MKTKPIIFLDNDGVICLADNWGSRYKKTKAYANPNPGNEQSIPVEFRFDNFDKKAIKVLNEIITETDCEIVVSSDWRHFATLEELGEYYLSQGIIKKPIGYTTSSVKIPEGFKWVRQWDLEQERALEIKEYLMEHPEITHWVAVDDLNMGITEEWKESWGLTNFVYTPLSREGIKQSGVKEKIIKYLVD